MFIDRSTITYRLVPLWPHLATVVGFLGLFAVENRALPQYTDLMADAKLNRLCASSPARKLAAANVVRYIATALLDPARTQPRVARTRA